MKSTKLVMMTILAAVFATLTACGKKDNVVRQDPPDSYVMQAQKVNATSVSMVDGKTYVTWDGPTSAGRIALPDGMRIVQDNGQSTEVAKTTTVVKNN
jgi:hypothetical protein